MSDRQRSSAGTARTTRRPRLAGGPLALVLLLVAGALALAGCGEDKKAQTTTETEADAALPALGDDAARVEDTMRDIDQRGLLLGDPQAPVTIIEYASLGCPTCREVHETVVPEVIDRFVRTGEASLELRPFAETPRALEHALGAHAASAQRRGWDQAQLALLRGKSGSGEPPGKLAAALGLDLPRWRRDLERPRWHTQVLAANNVVSIARFEGTPVFLVRRNGSDASFVVVAQPASADELEQAIEEAERA